MLNLLAIVPGQVLRLKDGSSAEVTENIGDGIWLQLRTLSHPSDESQVGTDELVHCEEMVGLVDGVKT